MKSPDSPNPRDVRAYVALSQVGLEMIVPMAVGYLLDRWWNTLPWATLVFLVFGMGYGVWRVQRVVNRIDRKPGPDEIDSPK